MTDERNKRNETFVNAVRDHLNGTPNASHPVQFEPVPGMFSVACTLCGSLVPMDDRWKDLHRENHDKHNEVHANIEDQARRYVSPPRYG